VTKAQLRHGFTFNFELSPPNSYLLLVTAEMFRPEIDEALKMYERYIVCIDKVPDDCERSLESLMEKAIKAYEKRGANMRHGIALDRHVTIILSQTDHDRPLCGIYFNLHSPYQKKVAEKAAKAEK
jgi:hypothetical protein